MLFIAVPYSKEVPGIHRLGLSMAVLAKLANVHRRLPPEKVLKLLHEGLPPAASVDRDPKTVALYAIGGALFWEAVDHIVGFHPAREYTFELQDLIVRLVRRSAPKDAFLEAPAYVLKHLSREGDKKP